MAAPAPCNSCISSRVGLLSTFRLTMFLPAVSAADADSPLAPAAAIDDGGPGAAAADTLLADDCVDNCYSEDGVPCDCDFARGVGDVSVLPGVPDNCIAGGDVSRLTSSSDPLPARPIPPPLPKVGDALSAPDLCFSAADDSSLNASPLAPLAPLPLKY